MFSNLKKFSVRYSLMSLIIGGLIYFITFPLLFLSPSAFTSLVIGGCVSSFWYSRSGMRFLSSQKKWWKIDFKNQDLHFLVFSAVSALVLVASWFLS
jgi:hypothetical protein